MRKHIRVTTRRRRARQAFTLVELLIVMAILVLLVSLVGPRILGSKKKADINAAKTQIGLFEACLEGYAVDMNTFPTTEEGLQALVQQPSSAADEGMTTSTTTAPTTTSNWDGPYLKKSAVPVDPWGSPYQYEYPPTHGRDDQPDIWSLGPDRQDGTEDDIVNWSGSATGEGGESDDFMNDQPSDTFESSPTDTIPALPE